jgi:hypothetical protein
MKISILRDKKVILIVVVLILLLVGGYFIMKGKSKAPSTTGTSQEESSPSSLKDLISKGIAQSCTYSNEGSSGKFYVSGSKVRGDFETTVEGNVTKSHMIIDGNTSYIWSDGQKSGIKMTFDSSATPSGSAATSPAGSFDTAANMNYKCSVWVVDSSVFTLPVGVTFMTFGTPTGVSPETGSNSSQCSYCESLTGDSKTQCLTALKCN